MRQIFDDPAGDHDWGISAEVDLAASDEAGEAVLRVTESARLLTGPFRSGHGDRGPSASSASDSLISSGRTGPGGS